MPSLVQPTNTRLIEPVRLKTVIYDDAKLDPWYLPGASEGENYFFRFREAPANARKGGGGRRGRAGSSYWKATGKEKPVFLQGSGCGDGGKQQIVGVRMALVFHRGKPPSRTDWVVHEFRLAAVPGGAAEQKKSERHNYMAQPGEWVVGRVFLKSRARKPTEEADSQTPGSCAAVVHPTAQHQEDAGPHQPLLRPPSSSSSSSCVTDISDQEEVSSSQ